MKLKILEFLGIKPTYSGQNSAQSVQLHSNVNQMSYQSTTVNSNAGQAASQAIPPTTPFAKSDANQTPKVIPSPYPAVISSNQKPLPPINKPQSELSETGPSQTDGGDNNAINDPQKPEDQQNVENS